MTTIGLLYLLIMFANFNHRPATHPVNPLPPPPSNVVGKVLAITGTANISRPNVRRQIRVLRNVQLISGDALKVENLSTVKIVCLPNSLISLPAGTHNNVCPANQPADEFTQNLNRGRTEVVTRANGQIIFRPKANNYPEYLAKIIDGRPGYWASSISLKKLLPDDARNDLVNRIRALPSTVSPDEKRLLLVDVYSMNSKYDRATEELSAVSNAANDPFIQINLGDLYLAQSQSGDAKRAFSSAIQAAVAANEPLAEAIAQHAFGLLLKYEKARKPEAIAALSRAISLYRDLGETVVGLESELKELQPQPPNNP